MKRAIIWLIVLYTSNLYCGCPAPQSGTRVWDIAATALELIITTESILDELLINVFVDITGVYTVAAAIDAGVTHANTTLYTINSELDRFITDITQTQSKLFVLESELVSLNTLVDIISADISGTYTALDALEATIISELDILATELEAVQTVIIDITATAIDHNVTIASQLDVLQIDVNVLNSVLDSINWPNLNTSIDTLSSLITVLANNVDSLQSSIQVGFAGTFTALDAQMNEIDIIQSTAENIHVINMTDQSGVFTALAQLDATLNNIESLTDIVTLVNAKNTAIVTESLMERAVSRVDVIESKIALLPSVADHVISVLEHVELPLLDKAISKLDITLTELDTLESQTDTISSKLSEVIIDNRNNTSSLSLIANTSIAIASSLDNVNLPISKLSFVNSQLDDVVQDAFTIESLIDKIFVGLVTINSKLDPLISQAELIDSLLGSIASTDVAISSKLDLTINNLTTVNSNLDQITKISQSSLSTLVTIESSLDRSNSMFDTLAISTIESKLAVTSNLETSVISKLDLANNLIATLNDEAQGLIGDFQSTWTILNKINSTSLPSIQTTLNIIESTLEHLNPYSISTVFTVIDVIVRNEVTINSQVDVYNSMVDAFTRRLSTDFNGVFTALGAINSSLVSSTSQLANISSKVSVVQPELGFPIYARDIPLTITTPGRYYLAENINYSGASNAITINTNNVTIDLNENVLNYSGSSNVSGILVNIIDNVKIINGLISNFFTGATGAGSGNIRIERGTNIIIKNMAIINGAIAWGAITRNIKIDNCLFTLSLATNGSIVIFTSTNALCINCTFLNSGGFRIRPSLSAVNTILENSVFYNDTAGNAIRVTNGTAQDFLIKNIVSTGGLVGVSQTAAAVTAVDILDSIFSDNNASGFTLISYNSVIKNNIIKNSITGISGGMGNCFIGFNTVTQNTSGNIIINSGADTVLGNFAFNTNATGNPNNTNYNVSGSTTSITGKFTTGSQRGSFGDFPDKWHNINMLP